MERNSIRIQKIGRMIFNFSKIKLNKKNYTFFLLGLILILVSTLIAGLSIGSVKIPFSDILSILIGNTNNSFYSILIEIRLPRVILAASVGGGLSIAGAVFQSILKNPLAEPYILGISGGGAFGAIVSMLIGIPFLGTQLMAFAGTLTVIFLVFFLGKRFGELEPNTLLLSGVMTSAFFGAAILLMLTMLDNTLRNAIFWMIGNLSLATPQTNLYLVPTVIICSLFLILNSNKFNLLSLGESQAKQLGINAEKTKIISYLGVSLMVGTIVASSGLIGFVGLLIPHVSRLIFGVDNRKIFPASFFLGASYLILADIISRTIISPAELPVGAITAILGAPIFIIILRKNKTF